MPTFYQNLVLFIVFFGRAELWAIPLGDYLIRNKVQGVYLDSHLKNLVLEAEDPDKDFSGRLTILSRSLPLRLIQDKGYLKVLPPFHREIDEEHAFRATIIVSAMDSSDELIQKISDMNGWFLRLRVEPFLRQGIRWVELKMSHEFFLNQFHDDFTALCSFLFGNASLVKVKDLDQWIRWQRQLIWENYEGTLPDPTTLPNPKFARQRRRGVLSTVLK